MGLTPTPVSEDQKKIERLFYDVGGPLINYKKKEVVELAGTDTAKGANLIKLKVKTKAELKQSCTWIEEYYYEAGIEGDNGQDYLFLLLRTIKD